MELILLFPFQFLAALFDGDDDDGTGAFTDDDDDDDASVNLDDDFDSDEEPSGKASKLDDMGIPDDQ